jgi:peptide methionine sulfoxide reductase msrA/msrB
VIRENRGEKPMKRFAKPNRKELKEKLSPLQFSVTQEDETERPFENLYWDNKAEGIYVDIVSGEPLFSSLNKYDSGTGWPSFTCPLEPENLVTKTDRKFFVTRTEVRSRLADSHLGHLFDDGPAPSGLRYCMNSAALRFVPREKLEAEGYGRYLKLFSGLEKATLAGGCFWGVEELFRQLEGVTSTTVGYTGGSTENPRYEDVRSGTTGHAEAIEIEFDPRKLSYEEVLRYFFKLHDPTTPNRQGNDRGTQYRSAIFFHSEEQRLTAERMKSQASGPWKGTVVTEIVPASSFYPAEDFHQDYLQKNPGGYTCHYLRPLDL